MLDQTPDLFAPPPDYAPRSTWQRDCSGCGACCAAPDIAALNKPLGMPCLHLGTGCLCQIYSARPEVCRAYTPDWVCGEVAPGVSLETRVARFLEIYGLEMVDTDGLEIDERPRSGIASSGEVCRGDQQDRFR
ncbi:YkgJ family cysteine cluster protein [Deinococcus sp.]|uniref:YkgJ family cysteine cluster protein n=1 Tax=Deinococcus sp. TaxID=47478 RepID=UPI0025D6F30E|nr:YkgJ family cysteine cluster protein [Deinococcus sp.]